MAPPAPPPSPDSPRPLPRRPASRPAARSNRPRFGALDGLWLGALTALALALSACLGELTRLHLPGSLGAAGIVAALYLLGWRARDRAAGIGAALLVAISPLSLHTAAASPQSALFSLLCLLALFAFVAGSSLAALALAAAAALVRVDGLVLGLLLLGLSLAQGRKRAALGTALFLVPVLVGWAVRLFLLHEPPPALRLGLQSSIGVWLIAPPTLLLFWLLLPLSAEWSEAARRARWLPTALWAGASLMVGAVASLTTAQGMCLPLIVLLSALAGGGLSRLLPTLAGESPRPLTRYILATLAVLGLVGLHLRLE